MSRGLSQTDVETLTRDLLQEHDMTEIDFDVSYDPSRFGIGISLRLPLSEGPAYVGSHPQLSATSTVAELQNAVLAGVAHIYKLAYERSKQVAPV